MDVSSLNKDQQTIYYNGIQISLGTFWSKNSALQIAYHYDLNGEWKGQLRFFRPTGGGSLITNIGLNNVYNIKTAIEKTVNSLPLSSNANNGGSGYANIAFAKGQNNANKTVGLSWMPNEKNGIKDGTNTIFWSGKEGNEEWKVPMSMDNYMPMYYALDSILKGEPWLKNMEMFKEMAIAWINPGASELAQRMYNIASGYQKKSWNGNNNGGGNNNFQQNNNNGGGNNNFQQNNNQNMQNNNFQQNQNNVPNGMSNMNQNQNMNQNMGQQQNGQVPNGMNQNNMGMGGNNPVIKQTGSII